MAILEHSTNKVAAKWSIWSGCGRSDGEVDKWWVRADPQPKCSEWQERALCYKTSLSIFKVFGS